MIGPLVVKEVREHGWVAVGVLLLAVAEFLAFLEFSLRHEPPTALVVATNFTWATGPMVAAYTARRLFVLEQEHKTIQLLRSLPISPAAIAATKLTLGLIYNLGLNLGIFWVTAWVLQNQEILTLDWIGRLSIQVAVYVFAWFAIASFHAQLGGYRFAAWLVSLVALTSLSDVFDEPLRRVFWTAPLADDIETTRYATPWDAVHIGLAWASCATVATLALAFYRGGEWVDARFEPMSGRRRAAVTGVAIVALLGLEVASSSVAREPALFAQREQTWLRTTDAALASTATRIRAVAHELEQSYALAPMPHTLLRLRRDEHREAVLTRILKSGEVVVSVRADATPAVRDRGILTDILTGLTAGHWERVPATGVWLLGFAPFLLDDASLVPTAGRLADVGPEDLDDYNALRRRFGRKGAEAAGWVAWQALEAAGGPEAVAVLVKALFNERRSQTSVGLIVARWTKPRSVIQSAGVDLAQFDAEWGRIVESHRDRARPDSETWPAIRLERPDTEPPRLAWGALPRGAQRRRVELWWSVAPDLQPQPVPQDTLNIHPVSAGNGTRWIRLDPRLRIVATWVVDGEVQGWREVDRP